MTPSTEVLNVRASERRSAARPCGEGGGPARHDRAFGGRVSGLVFGEPVACRLVLPGGRCPRRVAGSPNRIVIAESSGGSHRACLAGEEEVVPGRVGFAGVDLDRLRNRDPPKEDPVFTENVNDCARVEP